MDPGRKELAIKISKRLELKKPSSVIRSSVIRTETENFVID